MATSKVEEILRSTLRMTAGLFTLIQRPAAVGSFGMRRYSTPVIFLQQVRYPKSPGERCR